MSKSKSDSMHEPILEDELHLDEDTLQSNVLDEPMVREQVDLRPWHRRPKTWLIGIAATLFLAGGVVAFIAWRNRVTSQEFFKSDWRRLSSAAERVVADAEQSNYSNFGAVEKSLIDLQEKIDESSESQSKQSQFLNDKNSVAAYKSGTDELSKYARQARTIAADLRAADSSKLDELGSGGTALKLAIDDMRRKLSYLQEDLPDSFYTLNERFATVKKAYEVATTEEKVKQDEAKSKEDQAIQDKANAEEAVSIWAQAYIAGKPADMKAVMTPAFIKEYDFLQVTSVSRKYNYPTTFRRVNTDKRGEQYEVVMTITYVTKSDYSPETSYTQTFAYLISQDATTKKWLVNSQRYQ